MLHNLSTHTLQVINGLCLALHYLQLPLYHPAFFVLVAGINLAVAVASPRRLSSSNGSSSEYYAVPLMHMHDVAPLVKAVKMMQHVRRKKEVRAVTLFDVTLVNVLRFERFTLMNMKD
jgi:hypothetical protein